MSCNLNIVLAVLMALTYRAYFPPQVNAQQGMRSEAGDMECISYCSHTRLGTTLMEVKWRLADRSLSETDLRAQAGQQGLEVTVYSDGFDRGQYASVGAVKPKALFRAPAKPGLQPPQSKLAGLEKLVIADVATRLDQPLYPLFLMQNQAASAAGAEWITVRMEGLNPGMDFTYRIPGGRSVVTCRAAVCPVDKIRVPAKSKPSPAPR
jgi:hypothetical protein